MVLVPLDGAIEALGDALERNGIAGARLAAVATIGGGAAIPLITQRLSEQLRTPVITTAEPGLTAAVGAALVADHTLGADAPTGLGTAADTPTGLAPSAWAAGVAGAAGDAAAGGINPASATFRGLAWSQDDDRASEPAPYIGSDYSYTPPTGVTSARPEMSFAHDDEGISAEQRPLPWYRRPAILFGAAVAAMLLAVGGLAITLTSSSSPTAP